MSKFNKGDKVRAVRDTSNWSGDQPLTAGAEHTVRGYSVREAEQEGYDIELDNYSFYRSSDFTLAQPEVRVGDKIKATRTYTNGDVDVYTGAVVYVGPEHVETHHRNIRFDAYTIEVIERAMDPLPTTTGAIIFATYNGVTNVALFYNGEHWLYMSTGTCAVKSLITAWVPAKVVPE